MAVHLPCKQEDVGSSPTASSNMNEDGRDPTTRPLTNEMIDAIIRSNKYVTPGPWETWAGRGWGFGWDEELKDLVPDGTKVCWPIVKKGSYTHPADPADFIGGMATSPDQSFCVNAREWFMPALEEIKALRAEVAKLKAQKNE